MRRVRDDRGDGGDGTRIPLRTPITLDVLEEPTPGLRDDGTPDPAYAASLGLRPAGAGRRAAAFAIDVAIWAALASPTIVGVVLSAPAIAEGAQRGAIDPAALGGGLVLVLVGLGLTAVFGLAQLIMHGLRGVTVGKAVVGLRSVNVETFARPGFWRIVLRALVLQASTLLLVVVGPALLFLTSALDPERRGRSWLDRVARAWVIDARRGLDPFDARALRHARKAARAPVRSEAPVRPSLSSTAPATGFVPAQRSGAGVVSGLPGAETWMPPALIDDRPAAPAPPAMPPAPAPTLTPAPPLTPAQPLTPATTGLRLHFDDGASLDVPELGLVGRDPEPGPDESTALLIALADPSMQLSKTHAAFGLDERGGLWVLDRGSTNGTSATTPAGELELSPGERTSIPLGSTVAVGGRTFRVTRG